MRKQGKSSDRWIDELYYWLDAQGLTTNQVSRALVIWGTLVQF
jgi:hypothetical protein